MIWMILALQMVAIMPAISLAAQVTLAWDPNIPTPDGYHVYQRVQGQSYDFSNPVWTAPGGDATQTTCTITNLADDTHYYFVVRAYVGSDESGDSNEVDFSTASETSSGGGGVSDMEDQDGDGVPDLEDAFPANANEWLDDDGDGIGNNLDDDDDNDGFSDGTEVRSGTDPYDPESKPKKSKPLPFLLLLLEN